MQDDRYEWVGVDEASRRLGKSPSTIRRMCEDPTSGLVCEQEPRARGDTRIRWLVRFQRPVTDASAPPTQEEPHPPAATTTALETLAAALAAERAERQMLSAEIRNLAERAARAEARAELESARAADLAARLEAAERERDRLAARPWWKWWT